MRLSQLLCCCLLFPIAAALNAESKNPADYPLRIHIYGHDQTTFYRWRELVVRLPVFGRSNTYFTCHLKTDLKDFAYTRHNGRMSSEPSAQFKIWMIKHDYDPEHGKDTPIKLDRPASPAKATDTPQ